MVPQSYYIATLRVHCSASRPPYWLAARYGMWLLAVTAQMEESTLLSKLAITIETVIFQADLVILLARRATWAHSWHGAPLLPWAIRAIHWSVVEALAPRAPVLGAECLAGKTLCIDTGVHSTPRLLGTPCRFLTEVLIVDYPARPTVPLTRFRNNHLVSHQFRHSTGELRGYGGHVKWETLEPRRQIWDYFPRLEQVSRLDHDHLPL